MCRHGQPRLAQVLLRSSSVIEDERGSGENQHHHCQGSRQKGKPRASRRRQDPSRERCGWQQQERRDEDVRRVRPQRHREERERYRQPLPRAIGFGKAHEREVDDGTGPEDRLGGVLTDAAVGDRRGQTASATVNIHAVVSTKARRTNQKPIGARADSRTPATRAELERRRPHRVNPRDRNEEPGRQDCHSSCALCRAGPRTKRAPACPRRLRHR